MAQQQFRFQFDRFGRWVMAPLGMGPANSVISVDADEVRVKLGWAFRARVPWSSITDARREGRSYVSRGAHGWRGRWLVNGSGRNLVSLTIDPPARGYVTGWPLKLRELIVSVEHPDDLVETLRVQ